MRRNRPIVESRSESSQGDYDMDLMNDVLHGGRRRSWISLVLAALGCSAADGHDDDPFVGHEEELLVSEASDALSGARPNACGFSSSSPPVDRSPGSSDPRSVRVVRCASATAASNARVKIVQTGFESGEFRAIVVQTRPRWVVRMFDRTCALGSGHFFNFADSADMNTDLFHVRTRGGGAEDGDNLQVYRDRGHHSAQIDLRVGELSCSIERN
jgi:hypothetical protein